ncbi:MAG: hypothetical protein AAF847_17050 [Bacteroidota bacterium]
MSNSNTLPQVFRIGDFQEAYEALIQAHEYSLVDVCGKDLKLAYTKLSSMFREMELHAERKDYDLKGVRMWLHVFWRADGKIAHLAYHLRPNSRNIDIGELEHFLLSFLQTYRFPLISEQDYALYTTASFPVYARRRKGN